MPRKRNPRTVAAEIIRNIKRNAVTMHQVWGSPAHAARVDEDGYKRWGLATGDDRTENQAEQWDRLAEFMKQVAWDARVTEGFAKEMAKRVRKGERW